MSLRLQICGFDLAKLRSLFGCGDVSVIDAVQAEFDRLAARNPGTIDDAFRRGFGAALLQAINGGVPFPDLEVEKEPHVQMAMMLAAHGQELLMLDSDEWNHMGVNEAYEEGDLFSPDESNRIADPGFFRDLGFSEFGDSEAPIAGEPRESGFAHLLYGRPLFGKHFDVPWSYYGYLSRTELAYLRSRLRPAGTEEEEDIGGELSVQLASDLARWCDQLLAAEKDLWCYWA